MNKYVLDASAVLALLNEEPGKERVEEVLAESMISSVNYCEVLGKLIDAGLTERTARETFDFLSIEIIPFDTELARLAAELRTATKKLGLSLGDRSCLALGLAHRGVIVITAEKLWAKLTIKCKVELIR